VRVGVLRLGPFFTKSYYYHGLLDVLVAIAEIERNVKRLLEECDRFHGFIVLDSDFVRATEFLKVGANEAFDMRVQYYASKPNFCPTWLDGAADETVDAALDWIPLSLLLSSSCREKLPSLREDLRKVLEANIEGRRNFPANSIGRMTLSERGLPVIEEAAGEALERLANSEVPLHVGKRKNSQPIHRESPTASGKRRGRLKDEKRSNAIHDEIANSPCLKSTNMWY
jgi:hypothetical protein